MSAIYKKELRSYFINPIGYVFVGVFLTLSSLLCTYTTIQAGTYNTQTYFTMTVFVLAIFIPILTMRSFSEEKKAKTDQLLLTAPISITSMVVGKFLAVFTIVAGSFLLTLVNLIPLSITGASERAGESYSSRHIGLVPSKVFGCIIGVILICMVFIAIGLFVSSLTENQLAAAVISIGIIAFLIAISFLNMIGSDSDGTRFIGNAALRTVIDWVSVLSRFSSFSAGKLAFADVLYYLSLTFVFLMLCVRVYDKKRYA